MERDEMIKKLMEKAHVTYEEAQEVLERCNWDLLDSIIYLERSGKVENNDTTTIIEVKEEDQKKDDNTKKNHESYGGIGEVIGRIFKGLGKIIAKGNKNYFEIKKNNIKTNKNIFNNINTFIIILYATNCSIINNRFILWV